VRLWPYVCLSVCLSVCHKSVFYENVGTDGAGFGTESLTCLLVNSGIYKMRALPYLHYELEISPWHVDRREVNR